MEKARSVDQKAAVRVVPQWEGEPWADRGGTRSVREGVTTRSIVTRFSEGVPHTEKARSVDQKAAARFERVEAQVAAAPGVFAAGGTVVSTWRTYRGRRLGPYFRLAYRKGGRQWSIYLGRSEGLARRVRDLLARLQKHNRWRRTSRGMQARARASLRKAKAQLKKELVRWGIHLKGWEFRGVRRALATAPEELINSWRRRAATAEGGFL
ncbi:MAG: hypothetical protein ABIP48_32935 [Planctomycetota bacterium]